MLSNLHLLIVRSVVVSGMGSVSGDFVVVDERKTIDHVSDFAWKFEERRFSDCIEYASWVCLGLDAEHEFFRACGITHAVAVV